MRFKLLNVTKNVLLIIYSTSQINLLQIYYSMRMTNHCQEDYIIHMLYLIRVTVFSWVDYMHTKRSVCTVRTFARNVSGNV